VDLWRRRNEAATHPGYQRATEILHSLMACPIVMSEPEVLAAIADEARQANSRRLDFLGVDATLIKLAMSADSGRQL